MNHNGETRGFSCHLCSYSSDDPAEYVAHLFAEASHAAKPAMHLDYWDDRVNAWRCIESGDLHLT